MGTIDRELARVETARAYQIGDFLLLRLTGEKPNACYGIDLQQSMLDVEPPTFTATWFIHPDRRCTADPVPFEHQEAFRVGVMRDTIVLHAAGHEMQVEVTDLSPEAEGLLAHLDTAGLLGSLPGDGPAEGTEAVGYSRAFDFTEAFRDAIGKIPTPPFPDWLAHYTVLEVGAEIGGVAGFNHLFVRVRGG